MSSPEEFEAWNNFVMGSQPDDHPTSSIERSAAIAKNYMNEANSGGINSFLTNSWELNGIEVLEALLAIGANAAAEQFSGVLEKLRRPVLASTQIERWNLLGECWPENADEEFDLLSDEAERGLMRVLEHHVEQNEEFYRSMGG